MRKISITTKIKLIKYKEYSTSMLLEKEILNRLKELKKNKKYIKFRINSFNRTNNLVSIKCTKKRIKIKKQGSIKEINKLLILTLADLSRF